MNFDFSEDLNQVRAEARAFLGEHAAGSARRALESGTGFDAPLWAQIGKLGWIGAAIPEAHGGSALGEEGLCVLAEELGRANAAVPFASTAYLAAQAIQLWGTPAQQAAYLPRLADGSLVGCFAWAEAAGSPREAAITLRLADGALYGVKAPVVDGGVAGLAVVAARDAAGVCLVLADLTHGSVTRESLATLDPSRDTASITFDGTPAEKLGGADGFGAGGLGAGGFGAGGFGAVDTLLDRAAVLFAFEQVGGAQACLDMARDYALQRMAFGRQIASFQAIKHKLADLYVAIELARSNAYYGAWALSTNAPELRQAAAAARVAAIHAYELASAENIQTHGGMGFTWEYDCHLYYRRAKHLSLAIGAAPFWKDRLIGAIEQRNAA